MCDIDTKGHRINLTQKRKAPDGQWQFYPVQRDGNKPDPEFIIIDGKPSLAERWGSILP